jgi:hypothetical protein
MNICTSVWDSDPSRAYTKLFSQTTCARSEGLHDTMQGEEPCVDPGGLTEPAAFNTGTADVLGSSEINKGQRRLGRHVRSGCGASLHGVFLSKKLASRFFFFFFFAH